MKQMKNTKMEDKKDNVVKQGLNISIEELRNLMFTLKNEGKKSPVEIPDNVQWLINIINKTPEQKDTWELELDVKD